MFEVLILVTDDGLDKTGDAAADIDDEDDDDHDDDDHDDDDDDDDADAGDDDDVDDDHEDISQGVSFTGL